jgi:hypothetical protein
LPLICAADDLEQGRLIPMLSDWLTPGPAAYLLSGAAQFAGGVAHDDRIDPRDAPDGFLIDSWFDEFSSSAIENAPPNPQDVTRIGSILLWNP